MNALRADAAETLRRHPLFTPLNDEGIRRVISRSSEIIVLRGDILRRRGERCSGIHVVAAGRVKLALESSKGEEQVISLLGPGNHFGEPLIYANLPCLSTVEALTDATLVCIPRDVVLDEIDRNAGFARHIIERLSKRLYQRTRDIEGYTLHTGTERLVNYLLSEEPESVINGARHVVLPERKGLIASRLNITQEHLSRILRELTSKQLIVVSGAHVIIPDVNRLQNMII